MSRVRPCTRVAAYHQDQACGACGCLQNSREMRIPQPDRRTGKVEFSREQRLMFDLISNSRTLPGPASFWWGSAPHHPSRASQLSQAFGRFPVCMARNLLRGTEYRRMLSAAWDSASISNFSTGRMRPWWLDTKL